MSTLTNRFATRWWPAGLALLGLMLTEAAHAEIPAVLTDKVSKGSGTIDVMKDVTAAELADVLSSGTLLLGVDVSEAADGLESSTSQGIAIKELELILTTTAGTLTFSSFYTNTTAMILEAGATVAQEYHTLFGSGGSNELTSSTSDFDISKLDDVIEVRDISYSGDILSAHIRVKFLDTAANAGGNESFFDYSNGFEELAILTTADAKKLDQAGIGIAEAPQTVTYAVSTPSGGDIAAPSGAPEPHWMLLGAVPALLLSRRKRR